jgi:hypothetical protein
LATSPFDGETLPSNGLYLHLDAPAGVWLRTQVASTDTFAENDIVCDSLWIGNGFNPGLSWDAQPCDLDEDETYWWRARLADSDPSEPEATFSEWTEESAFKVGPATSPPTLDAPTWPEPEDGTVSFNIEPTLSVVYHNATLASGYARFDIYDSAGDHVIGANGSWASTQARSSWTVPAGVLQPGETYTWRATSISDSSISASLETTLSIEPGPDSAFVTFVEPVSAADAAFWSAENDVGLFGITTQLGDPGGDEEMLQLGTLVPSEPPETFMRSMFSFEQTAAWAAAVQEEFNAGGLSALSALESAWNESEEQSEAVSEELVGLAAVARMGFSNETLLVSYATVYGETSALEALASNSAVESVSLGSVASGSGSSTSSCDADAPFWPQRGKALTRRTDDKKYRFIFQAFTWTVSNLENLKCFRRATYEAEGRFTKEHGTYLGKSVFWASTMPWSYLDTEVGPGNNGYTTHTVGTFRARKLKANREYYTFVLTKKTRRTGDRGILQGQRGKRRPAFCFHAHCVFPRRTANCIGGDGYYVPNTAVRHWTGCNLPE